MKQEMKTLIVWEWCKWSAKKISISDGVLQAQAKEVAEKLGEYD
jgi:hypothetical protein